MFFVNDSVLSVFLCCIKVDFSVNFEQLMDLQLNGVFYGKNNVNGHNRVFKGQAKSVFFGQNVRFWQFKFTRFLNF